MNKAPLLPISLLAVLFIITGCQNNKPTSSAITSDSVSPNTQIESTGNLSESAYTTAPGNITSESPKTDTDEMYESKRLQQCKTDLDILNTMKDPQYANLKASFDRLMRGAAQYAGVRSNINSDTQSTVDALYHYRVSVLCAQMNQSVLKTLVRKGEIIK